MSAFKFQWVPHNGGPMPVGAETLVEVRFRDAVCAEGSFRARYWLWGHSGCAYDIIAYRVVEVRP